MSLTEEPSTDELRRPCPSSWQAASDRSGLKVPFARCGDGVTRHVERIDDRSLGPFICLGCNEELIFRESQRARNHFAHRSDTRCSGETVLHRYAKELLARDRTFTLTPLILREGRLEEIVFQGGCFTLDSVLIEADRASFRPDAIVQVENQFFAIEFKVSNAVSEEKRAKVAATDLPMIEVDLNSIRMGQVDADALDNEILHGATRTWVHHPNTEASRHRLATRVETDKAERGKRLRYHIRKRNWVSPSKEWNDDRMTLVAEAGLAHLVGRQVDCAHWFCVDPRTWQAEILATCIIEPSIQYSPGSRNKIKGEWQNERSLASRIPSWMMRTDLSHYNANSLQAAGYTTTSFGSPDDAIRDFFFELSDQGDCVFWDREEQAFFIEPELHGYLHRRYELARKIYQIVEAAGAPDPDVIVLQWMTRYNVNGQSPERLAKDDSHAFEHLMDRVDNLLRMTRARHESFVVDDLCGLSLQKLRETRLMEKAQRDAEEVKRLANAAAERRNSLQSWAREGLGFQRANQWLDGISFDPEKTIMQWAGESDDQLGKAEHLLENAIRKAKAQLAAEEAVAGFQRQLEISTYAAISDQQRAALFIKAWRDKCDCPAALASILAKLPKRR